MNTESLSLDQMRAAVTVTEAESFSGAARRLNRKQSSVSYAVSNLERELGLLLFDRLDGQPPTPTPVGRVLLREMEAVLRNAEEIKNKARAVGHGIESEVSLAIDSFYPSGAFTTIMQDFAIAFPTVAVSIAVDSMGAVQKAVMDGKSDLGIAGSYPHLPAGLLGDAVTQITRVPVASPRHPLAALPQTGNEHPYRMLLDSIQIVVADRSDLTAGRDFSVYAGRVWHVTELMLKRELLVAGLGWGYLPEHLVAEDIRSDRLRILRVEGLRARNGVGLMVIRRRDRFLGPAAAWILERLMKQ
jgi:DNA-binding transcriptional LysR family regulator